MRGSAGNERRRGGLLLVDKPGGWTSHDVVVFVRNGFGIKKVGHAGTLDPLATGLLVLGLGRATRSLGEIASGTKEYVAGLLLGKRTSTGDLEGEVVESGRVDVSPEEVGEAVRSFTGDIWQVPPLYSAIKYRGRPLYSYARRGREVPREARRASIEEIEVLRIDLPEVLFRAVVSKGTYIRTLCEDIGRKLGCPATTASLVRTRVGEFRIEDAVTVDELRQMDSDMLEKTLIPINDEADNKKQHTRNKIQTITNDQ